MELSRDSLGYINLDKLGIAKIDNLFAIDSFSFNYNNERYFFKKIKSIDQSYNELIGYELAKDFGLDAIEYDLGSYYGFIGFISKDYSRKEYRYLESYINSYYGSYSKRNNIHDVSIMFHDIFSELDANNIMNDLYKLLMFDIIIANSDRHDRNIIIDSSTLRLGPVFDNEMLLNRDYYFSFSVTGKDDNTISEFLSILNPQELEFFVNKLEIINRDNLIKVFNRIEKKIGTSIVDGIKEEVLQRYSVYYEYLNRVIKMIRGNRFLLDNK